MKAFASALCLLFSSAIQAASFDCYKNLTSVEAMICQSELLSKADSELSALYLSAAKPDNSIKQTQSFWLAERNQCTDIKCLMWAYDLRIGHLKSFMEDAELNGLDCDDYHADPVAHYCESVDVEISEQKMTAAYESQRQYFNNSHCGKEDEIDCKTAKNHLTKAQKSWLQYRKDQCQFIASTIPYGAHGGLQSSITSSCYIRLNNERRWELSETH